MNEQKTPFPPLQPLPGSIVFLRQPEVYAYIQKQHQVNGRHVFFGFFASFTDLVKSSEDVSVSIVGYSRVYTVYIKSGFYFESQDISHCLGLLIESDEEKLQNHLKNRNKHVIEINPDTFDLDAYTNFLENIKDQLSIISDRAYMSRELVPFLTFTEYSGSELISTLKNISSSARTVKLVADSKPQIINLFTTLDNNDYHTVKFKDSDRGGIEFFIINKSPQLPKVEKIVIANDSDIILESQSPISITESSNFNLSLKECGFLYSTFYLHIRYSNRQVFDFSWTIK